MEISKYIQQSKSFDEKLLKIKVTECNEKFLDLKQLLSDLRVKYSEESNRSFFLRVSVAIAFRQIVIDLNKQGYIPKIEHAYRPLSLQKQMFQKRLQSVEVLHPNWPKDEVFNLANMFTAGIPILAAHTSGAAIDITLLDGNCNEMDMGAKYSELSERSITNSKNISNSAKKARTILCEACKKHGLINYPFEYWHFSMGDVCESYINGKENAIYSPVDFDPKKMKIEIIGNIDLYDYFTYR